MQTMNALHHRLRSTRCQPVCLTQGALGVLPALHVLRYDNCLACPAGGASALYSYSSLNNPRMAAIKAGLGLAYLWGG
jgi:hypothetical protein